jgi:hypothetical protein
MESEIQQVDTFSKEVNEADIVIGIKDVIKAMRKESALFSVFSFDVLHT